MAFITTDSAAYYVGKHAGMIQHLTNDNSFGRVTGLPDFCHKVERLLENNTPKWVQDTLDMCRNIASFINEHPNVKNHIHEFVNIEGFIFKIIPTTCETRFAQFLHLHLEAILSNIKVLIAALPSLKEITKLEDKVTSILKYITNENFVAKVLIISETYKAISCLEKEAQGEEFGPFQYLGLIERNIKYN